MATSVRAMLAQRVAAAQSRRILKGEEDASMDLAPVLVVVGIIIGAVVGLSILAALLPTFFTSLAGIGHVFSDPNTTTGNDDADALLPVFGLLIAFAGVFAIIGLAILVVSLKGKHKA